MSHNSNAPIIPKHDHATLTFPEGFLWGSATSAFQVEGNNTHSDWWAWEQKTQPKEKQSGEACDHYNRYEQDFELLKQLDHNAHRLSLEWSRIEPEEGVFNEAEIEHYKAVLKSLKGKNIKVMLTLHHFSNPLWLAKKGGWESFKTPYYFERYIKKIVPELKNYVDLWATINEPGVLMWGGYLAGVWPPNKKNFLKGLLVLWNLARAHKKAYKAIHNLVPGAQVGLVHHLISFNVFHQHSILENIVKIILDISTNHFIYMLTGKKTHDFLGLNYYINQFISFNGNAKLPKIIDMSASHKDVSDMGWEVYPEGMFEVLMDFSDFHKPIYITENGIATLNDDRRVRFLLAYLKEIYHAIQMGADIKGYFHWSFLDNYEWLNSLNTAEGYEPKFGLVEVDFTTQKRAPKPSAFVYQDIIKHNGITHRLMKFLGHRVKVEDVFAEPEHKD